MNKYSLLLCLGFASSLAAADPSPAQLQLAHDVIKAAQTDRVYNPLVARITEQSSQALNLGSINITAEQRDAAVKVQEQVLALTNEAVKSLISKMEIAYAEVYTEDELKAAKAFYESPEGRALSAKSPQVAQRMAPLQQAMMADLGPKLNKLITDARTAQAAAAASATPPTFTLPSGKP
jgi:uncharacterized protein